MNKLLTLLTIIILTGLGCSRLNNAPVPQENDSNIMNERVTFITSDNINIVGDYYAGQSGSPTALLLHMRPATRESWKEFAEKLVQNGFSALAIDLRGHGESIQMQDGRNLNYEQFSEAVERETIKDVEAAVAWLVREKSVEKNKIAIVGASIGANLAVQYLGMNSEITGAVLLSSGLVYRGIDTQSAVARLQPNQSVFYIAARDDQYAALTVGALSEQTKVPYDKKVYDSGGHAMNLFAAHPELEEEIIEWLKQKLEISN